MKVNQYDEDEQAPVVMDGASGCRVRWRLSERDGAPTFVKNIAPECGR